MKTFFNYIENLNESSFVNITGDTQTNFKQLKINIKKNRFKEYPYIEETTLKQLGKDFLKCTNVVQLEPLSEKPLSSQLYWLTGDFYSDSNYDRQEEKLISFKTKTIFILASQKDESLYKLKQKHQKELDEFKRLHKYDNYGNIIIDLHNPKRWREGLKLAEKGVIVEMTEESYDHFLNCLPPKDFCNVSFVTGEPYNHNKEGKAIYLCCIKKDGKFYAQYGTLAEYRNNKLFK